jgi:Lrp/AsnC family transcriptional regulator for asnA, asnC and gidA
MDEKDKHILETLIKNSRTPITHIASSLGISETAVRKRISKLEKNGVIRSYTAVVDPFFMGYESVALIGIDTLPEKILTVFGKVRSIQRIRNVALTTGDHMIMFEAWCRNPKELETLLRDIERMEGVTRVCPAIFIKRAE